MFMPRLAALALALALGCAACASQETPPAPAPGWTEMTAEAAARGQRIAVQTCSGCHAVGADGASPMAEATPFRVIVHRYPLEQLQEAFAEGLVTGNPAMPAHVFRASEIDDLIAYLETVKARQ